MQIKTVYSEFLFDCEVKHFSSKTMKGYRNNLQRFFNYLDAKYGVQDIEEVTAKQIKDFFRELWRNGRKVTVEAVERIVAKTGRIAEVDNSIRCSPHTLRHYFAQAQLCPKINNHPLCGWLFIRL